MPALTNRELQLVEEVDKSAAEAAIKGMDHSCHFPEDQRRQLHKLTEDERVDHLCDIADSAKLVGIKSDGHVVLFSIGRQVTIVGQKAVGIAVGGFLLLVFAIVVFLVGGWKPLLVLMGLKGV